MAFNKGEQFSAYTFDYGSEENSDSEDENTEKSIHILPNNYKMFLNEYKEEWANTVHINASLRNGANVNIGWMRAYLFHRGDGGNVNFWSECDEENQETSDVAMMFTKQDGRLQYDKIEGLDKETDELASSRGGFLVLEEVRIEKEERGKDVGLDMVEALLDHLSGRWTIAWVRPFTLTRDSKEQSKEEWKEGNIRLARHFARLGFVQASTQEKLNSCTFWYLIPARRARKSKQDVKNLPVTFVKQNDEWSNVSSDVEQNILVDAVLAEDDNGDCSLEEITRLVMNGEDINESEVLFYAIPNGKVDVVKHLLGLGADIKYRNGFGASALHLAAASLDAEMCELLLTHGAEKDAADGNGETPFEEAVRAIEDLNKFMATFDLNKIRVTQFEERHDKLAVLHLLAKSPLQLLGGIITPRMFYRLKVTAQVAADLCRDSMPHFEKGVPIKYEDASYEVHLLSQVPENEVPKEIYKSYAWGWQQQLKAIGDVMERGLIPTGSRVQEELLRSGSDSRYNSHYKEKGGSLLQALVALVETARCESKAEGDGQFEEIHGEALEQIPAMQLLDDDFLFVHYFFVSYCVTPGAAIAVPEINI